MCSEFHSWVPSFVRLFSKKDGGVYSEAAAEAGGRQRPLFTLHSAYACGKNNCVHSARVTIVVGS